MSGPVNSQERGTESIFLRRPWINFLTEVCEIARLRFPSFVAPIADAIVRAVPEEIGAQGLGPATIRLSQRQRENLVRIIIPYVKQSAPALFVKPESERIRIGNMCDPLASMLKVRE